MKKVILVFIGVIVGLFVFLSSIDQKSEYVAEKEFWKINQKFQIVSIDPNAVPQKTFNELIRGYQSFVKKFPGSTLAPQAEIFLGRVYALQKEYAKARGQWELVVSKYKDKPEIAAQAVSDIGRSYSIQEDWDNIIKTYERIRRDYPLTEIGLNVPLLTAQFYVYRKDYEKARKSFQNAVAYYQSMGELYPNSMVEFMGLRLLANCYFAQKRFEEAVDVLQDMLMRFSNPPFYSMNNADFVIKAINTISIQELEDYDVPVDIYTKFIEEHPKHPLNKPLNEMIVKMKGLKEKNKLLPEEKDGGESEVDAEDKYDNKI